MTRYDWHSFVYHSGEEAMLIRIGRFEVEFGLSRTFFISIPYIGQMYYNPLLGLYVDSWKTCMALEDKRRTKGFA